MPQGHRSPPQVPAHDEVAGQRGADAVQGPQHLNGNANGPAAPLLLVSCAGMSVDRIYVRAGLDSRAIVAALAVIVAIGCQRRPVPAAPGVVTDAGPADARAAASPPSPPADKRGDGPKLPDGRSLWSAEWVDADVIRVGTLYAITVEANQIRCPHVRRTGNSAPVPEETGWWRVEGDLVEADSLTAHHVWARLIIADQIAARVVKTVRKPHRWTGARGAEPVRNRVTLPPGFERSVGDVPAL